MNEDGTHEAAYQLPECPPDGKYGEEVLMRGGNKL